MQRSSDRETAVLYEAPSSVDELVAASPPRPDDAPPEPITGLRPGEVLVGECLDARHPTLAGRLLVRWTTSRGALERWLPSLHGLAVRAQDRVLVSQPSNWPEPLVTGVVDGFALRPEPPLAEAARLTLHGDEALRVAAADGKPLVEVFASETGPVIRLMTEDADIELKGALRISARSIDLVARQGEVRVNAADDVIVQGENIHLN
ncbi:hypothetical protein predicted by Glimmer/Critica [Sorangium cellulosum So ce56]|uniref:Uncharacterized protein n=1 Tax=Sorangium cellulosum (strain So ce56) TaxID=448385 RepID=A9FHD5_SORC5|nr:hypothetical protein [Sorangium cellulosum]CAN98205.1 hypothetical protein predicted by Glimmer/Critica [Sorangium cellulosum So ce56]